MRFSDIDWNGMWLESRRKKSWRASTDAVWDKRADSFARRNMLSPYVDRFLQIINPTSDITVLDFGAGPGTLAIPLARKVKQVTAVDFSARMVALLQEAASTEKLRNIDAIQGAWTDDWTALGLVPCDVVIASRSLSVDDLQGALIKLDSWARKSVYISDRVGAGPFDPELYAAIGREFESGPDYIFTLNILYQLGINASVDYITLDHAKTYEKPEDAVESSLWMFENLSPSERERLTAHIADRLQKTGDGRWLLRKKKPTKWAVISWHKEGPRDHVP